MNIARLFRSSCVVETLLGPSGDGDNFDTAFVDARCNVEVATKTVRDASGNEIVSSSTIYALPGNASRYTPGSRVTPGLQVIRNQDGTYTIRGAGVTANEDGTYTIRGTTVTANEDGTYAVRGGQAAYVIAAKVLDQLGPASAHHVQVALT